MATGYARLAHESIPGNEANSPTLGTKKLFPRLQSLTLNPGVGHLERDDELLNTDEPVPLLPESYDPSWELEQRMYPDAVGYLLAVALGLPTTTAGDGIITDPDTVAIPVGAYRHVWTAPFGPSGASPKTMQIDSAYKDQSVFLKAKGAVATEVAIESPEKGGVGLKASGPALYLIRGSDPSLTPAYEAETIPPFLRSHLTLPTWLTGSAAFREFSMSIVVPAEVRHAAGSGSKYPDIVYKGDSPIRVIGSVPKELIDVDDWDALIAATGFAAKALWTSTAIIATAYPYKLYVQLSNCQYTEGSADALSNRRRLGASFNFVGTRSASASATITLVNATASYA